MNPRDGLAVRVSNSNQSADFQKSMFACGITWANGTFNHIDTMQHYPHDCCIAFEPRDNNRLVMVYSPSSYFEVRNYTVVSFDEFFRVSQPVANPYMGLILGKEGGERRMKKLSEALGVAVDRLGRVREQLKNLKEEEDEAKKEIIGYQLAIGDYEGEEFKLAVAEVATSELSPIKVEEFLPHDQFVQVIRVIKKEAERYMSKEEMDKCSEEPTITTKYTTRRLKK